MKNIIIYRVQDKEGRGPFRPGLSQYWTDDDRPESEYRDLHPWPMEFGLSILRTMKPNEVAGCGCRSLGDIERWFNKKERDKLALMGFQFVKMRVDRILAEGPNQLVFARSIPLNQNVEII